MKRSIIFERENNLAMGGGGRGRRWRGLILIKDYRGVYLEGGSLK